MCPIWVGESLNASCGSCIQYAGSAANMIIGLGLLALTNGEITEWNMYGLRFDLQKITEPLILCRARDKPSFTNQIQYGVPSGAAGGELAKTLSGRRVTDLNHPTRRSHFHMCRCSKYVIITL